MGREAAEKQKQKAKDMLGISDDRAQEIFQEQPDRKQQKKQELKDKDGLVCPDCGDEFSSEKVLNAHREDAH
ncbi:MAG: hypothetical protein ABEK16_01755 [Candidatus Nanohalobium sp.]